MGHRGLLQGERSNRRQCMLIFVDYTTSKERITYTSIIHRDLGLSLDLENSSMVTHTTISQRLLEPVSASLYILCNFCSVSFLLVKFYRICYRCSGRKTAVMSGGVYYILSNSLSLYFAWHLTTLLDLNLSI